MDWALLLIPAFYILWLGLLAGADWLQRQHENRRHADGR